MREVTVKGTKLVKSSEIVSGSVSARFCAIRHRLSSTVCNFSPRRILTPCLSGSSDI